jgi:rhodanese-related sulfurtransferase
MEQREFYKQKLAFETDSWDLNEMLQRGEAVVVDVRGREAFERKHIPGAVHLPHRQISELTIKELPQDLLLVTYCDGVGCNASTKGALNLARPGLKVKELFGGLGRWKRDGYPPEGAATFGGAGISCGC